MQTRTHRIVALTAALAFVAPASASAHWRARSVAPVIRPTKAASFHGKSVRAALRARGRKWGVTRVAR